MMISLPDPQRYFPQTPEVFFDERKTRTFDEVWETTLQQGQSSRIDYRCDYPKHEFLTYLVERKGFLLHGSNFPDIKTLIPIRITKDTTSYGNHEAVYACADGIWAIWFAIVNRNLDKTSWLSACRRAIAQDGTANKFYFFSVNQQVPLQQRWTEGVVYVLPRDTFNQLSDDAGCLVEEWASAEPVTGLAKLPVRAHDFPFHDSVQSHDDEWLTLEKRSAEVDARVYDSYVGRYSPAPGMVFEVNRDGDCIFLKVPGYPPGVMWFLSETLFALPPLNMRVSFDLDDRKRATRMTINLDGHEIVASRID